MLCTENIVKHLATSQFYECTCSEKNGVISVRDIETGISLRGGSGLFNDEHPVGDFEKVATNKYWHEQQLNKY